MSVGLVVMVVFACNCAVLQSFCKVTHVMFMFCTVTVGELLTSEIKMSVL